ncbi:hypothetical protein MILUP08_45410 [Micromonospora lupini str. Lupac 08]|uniref:Uncharacterized protein n=1 Tax=Micromonospora lupini str. Lupac 08 TaxID=1150864 RepID=I0L9N0_9ACTN|nr:hypothetical protein MILUP08_45410 [Micromonospora lupini str. Lupac 08]
MPEQQDHARVGTAPERREEQRPLLASRLTPTVPPEPVVARPRLLRRLDEGAPGRSQSSPRPSLGQDHPARLLGPADRARVRVLAGLGVGGGRRRR